MFGLNRDKTDRSKLPDLDKCQSLRDITWVFTYVFHSDKTIALQVVETIHRIFTKVNVFINRELYHTFKNIRIYTSDINRLGWFPKEIQITLLCIASQNGNGYVREKALDKLIEMDNETVLPFFLFRLADWVDVIRVKAEKAVLTIINRDNVFIFLKYHRLIKWLANIERNNLSGFYNTITNCIISSNLSDKELQSIGW